jgi:hypothetical protein
MSEDTEKLYRELGYDEPLPPPTRRRGGEADRDEIPPLTAEQAEELWVRFSENPTELVARARVIWDRDMTESRLAQTIQEARAMLRAPVEAREQVRSRREGLSRGTKLPADFTFPGIEKHRDQIDPGNHKFQDKGDELGWLLFSGPYLLLSAGREPPNFRFHEEKPSRFSYELPDAGPTLTVSLFSDFGTGLYHALYIADLLREAAYPYALHLGDVYYSGRKSEFRDHFEKQLDPLLGRTALYTLHSNHEMYSLAKPYFKYLDNRAYPSGQPRQEGSYFRLIWKNVQFVGIDTASFGDGRFREPRQRAWLEEVLEDGRRAQRVTILLSANEPYDYGEKEFRPLLREDLDELVADRQLVDLWFWGNVHYCALFEPTPRSPFFGSCIGHSGYPYSRKRRGEAEPAPLLYLEEGNRFLREDVRPDMGNNGFCVLEVREGSIAMSYRDWMGNIRCKTDFSVSQGRLTLAASPVLPGPGRNSL